MQDLVRKDARHYGCIKSKILLSDCKESPLNVTRITLKTVSKSNSNRKRHGESDMYCSFAIYFLSLVTHANTIIQLCC